MTNDRPGRRFCSAAEYAEATGQSTWVVHWELRTGRLRGRDLNEGTPKRPRWRVFASELRRRDGATHHQS